MMYTAYHKRLLIRVLCSNCARGMSSLKTSSYTQVEQWKTTIDLPHINLIIFPAPACPSSLFKHSKSIVVFHCSACLLQDFCNLLYKEYIHYTAKEGEEPGNGAK